jgi:hypothetical protein
MKKMMEGLAAGQQTAAVDYERLKERFPEVSGWTRGAVTGEQGAMMNMSYSKAEGEYTSDGRTISLEITDTALIQAMVMPFAMVASGGLNQKSDSGFKRGVTIGGHPGWEEWENAGNQGEVSLLVAKRFVVHADGRGVANIETVRAIVEAVDLGALAALK